MKKHSLVAAIVLLSIALAGLVGCGNGKSDGYDEAPNYTPQTNASQTSKPETSKPEREQEKWVKKLVGEWYYEKDEEREYRLTLFSDGTGTFYYTYEESSSSIWNPTYNTDTRQINWSVDDYGNIVVKISFLWGHSSSRNHFQEGDNKLRYVDGFLTWGDACYKKTY